MTTSIQFFQNLSEVFTFREDFPIRLYGTDEGIETDSFDKIQMFVIWIFTNVKRKFIKFPLKTIDFISLYIVEKIHFIYLEMRLYLRL